MFVVQYRKRDNQPQAIVKSLWQCGHEVGPSRLGTAGGPAVQRLAQRGRDRPQRERTGDVDKGFRAPLLTLIHTDTSPGGEVLAELMNPSLTACWDAISAVRVANTCNWPKTCWCGAHIGLAHLVRADGRRIYEQI